MAGVCLNVFIVLLCVLDISHFNIVQASGEHSMWSDWWSYDGISGPVYWGLLNSDWALCHEGRYQSPIDIQPKRLVYDPLLSNIHIEDKEVMATIVNTGRDVSINLDSKGYVVLTGGPLAYTYKIYQIKIHFGSTHDQGSEHSIDGKTFPVEFQLLGYNEDLYMNASEAATSPHGLTGLAVFAQVDNSSKENVQEIFNQIQLVPFKGNQTNMRLELSALLPETHFYMTYDGSLTFPPCQEVVTWLVMNRPISITDAQFQILRQLYQEEEGEPNLFMENNFRRPVPLGNRTIRTNIRPKGNKSKNCDHGVQTNYKINDRFRH